ncbi:DNA phosphorothioation-dependent restriction protein DptF [Halomonas heilongjiangensis]|uniref:DNA phosphorothioation-dependent restriction protein DptF n=1 Tax=Halomonas heilongjiangensis TaxID=1387883 RepID=UPI00147640EC|nr:DNA phosphorothioation-dependent restriction protein DptF [Halomonas heilongjiangensis]
MNFRILLDTLAKSSAQAVTTLGRGQGEAEELKEYLYVETAIERDFKEALDSCPSSDSIIFLCGSSGDGKSEVLKRYYKRYSDTFRFHLDATHSFRPDQGAIEALDQLFDEHKTSNKPLVIGINVGMLFNYTVAGAGRHQDIKSAIEEFTRAGHSSHSFSFLNFEDYPKFRLESGFTGSAFISDLLERVVHSSEQNPLYRAYQDASEISPGLLTTNYRLLQQAEVRERIVQLLLSARLRFDQFLSARGLLDFIHHLICGPRSLFDNLFVRGHNDLCDIISHFDPCSIRSQKLDQFLIQHSLGVKEQRFTEFQEDIFRAFDIKDLDAAGWLRLFYVLQDLEIGNKYHQEFVGDFQRPLYDRYIDVWRLHAEFDGDSDKRQLLRKFYQDELVSALMRFGNRLSPSLTKRKHMYLCKRNKVVISAKADVRPDFKGIKEEPVKSIHEFPVCLKVESNSLRVFQVNVSFLELVTKINNGYRPNKHDKNTIVILEEIVDEMSKVVVQAKTLFLTAKNRKIALTNEADDGEFVVGGDE